jgi:hypothetical protein
MTFDIVWSDASFGQVRAPYATENEAVTQALHDMYLGKDVERIQDGDTGQQIWSRDQLKQALHEGHGG